MPTTARAALESCSLYTSSFESALGRRLLLLTRHKAHRFIDVVFALIARHCQLERQAIHNKARTAFYRTRYIPFIRVYIISSEPYLPGRKEVMKLNLGLPLIVLQVRIVVL